MTPPPAAELDLDAIEARANAAPYQIGQEVTVTDEKLPDWHGMRLWICGMQWEPTFGGLNYWLSEHWPPRGNGDMTDCFREGEFHARTDILALVAEVRRLEEFLTEAADRLETCAKFSGTSPEYAAIAVQKYRNAAIRAAR